MSALREALDAAGFLPGDFYQLAAIRNRKITTRTFETNKGLTQEDFETCTDEEGWIGTQKGKDLYICLNPIKDAGHAKATLKRIQQERCLLIDFDPVKTDDDSLGLADNKRAQTLLAARAWVKTLKSGTIVDSGRGHQVWTLHDKSISRHDVVQATKWWAREFPLVCVDATQNADRLARLPGTVNSRTGRVACLMKS